MSGLTPRSADVAQCGATGEEKEREKLGGRKGKCLDSFISLLK
jgi:hypothetical protein